MQTSLTPQLLSRVAPPAPLPGQRGPAAPSPRSVPGLHAGSRGIWKDTRPKPLNA